jgi:hypothetical protein
MVRTTRVRPPEVRGGLGVGIVDRRRMFYRAEAVYRFLCAFRRGEECRVYRRRSGQLVNSCFDSRVLVLITLIGPSELPVAELLIVIVDADRFSDPNPRLRRDEVSDDRAADLVKTQCRPSVRVKPFSILVGDKSRFH